MPSNSGPARADTDENSRKWRVAGGAAQIHLPRMTCRLQTFLSLASFFLAHWRLCVRFLFSKQSDGELTSVDTDATRTQITLKRTDFHRIC